MFIRCLTASVALHALLAVAMVGLEFMAPAREDARLSAARGMSISMGGFESSERRRSALSASSNAAAEMKPAEDDISREVDRNREAATSKNGNADSQNGRQGEQDLAAAQSGVVVGKSSLENWGIVYPGLAREMGKEGVTVIRCLLPPGERRCSRALIRKTSGHEELDRAALGGIMSYDNFPANARERIRDISVAFRLID